MAMIFSSSTHLRRAQARHCRSTEAVESTRTPSRSKRIAEQWKIGILIFPITRFYAQARKAVSSAEEKAEPSFARRRIARVPVPHMPPAPSDLVSVRLVRAGGEARRTRRRQHSLLRFLPHQQISLAEVRLGAHPPRPHKPVVQSRAEGRTEQRNHPARPLFHDLPTRRGRNALNYV